MATNKSMDIRVPEDMVVVQGVDSSFNLTKDALNDSSVREMLRRFFHESDELTSPFMEAVLIAIYTILSVTAIISNLVILVIILRTKRLWVPTHLLLVNLMIADIALASICMPFTLFIFIRRSWPFGQLCCKIIPMIQGVSVFATSITIAVIAADRWCRITSTRPTPVNQRTSSYASCAFSKTKLMTEVGMIWFISIVVSLPQAVFQEEAVIGIPPVYSFTKCIEEWPGFSRGYYSLSILLIQLLVPTACLVASFFKIRKYLKKNLQRVLDRAASPSFGSNTTGAHTFLSGNQGVSASNNNSSPNHLLQLAAEHHQSIQLQPLGVIKKKSTVFSVAKKERSSSSESGIITLDQLLETEDGTVVLEGLKCTDDRQKKRILREIERNQKVTNTLLYVCGEFIFCWLPWNAFNIYIDFYPDAFDADTVYTILACGHIIAMSSSTLNALLYGFTNSNIKRELSRLWSDRDSSEENS